MPQGCLWGSLGYPSGAVAELLDGTLKLRYCTTVFTKRVPPGFYQGLVEGLLSGVRLLVTFSWIVGVTLGYGSG